MLFDLGADRRASRVVERTRMLYFIYAVRLTVCLGVFGSALAAEGLWGGLSGDTRAIALGGMALAGLATPVAYWWSHVRREDPGTGFVYGQAVLDILLVTGIVHITGGSESVFPPLFYISLASGYALVLPFASAVLVALATGVAYLGEIALAYPSQLGLPVLLQIAIFTVVASISSVIGGRLRQVRAEVRRLEGELHRLRLGTTDLLRTIDSGVVTLDGDGRLAYMNPAAEELLGVDAELRLGEPFLPFLDDRATGLAAAVRETLWGEEGVHNRETDLRRVDGTVVPVSVSTALMERPRTEPSVTLALQDLRPIRRLEELRLRTERLEAVAELSASLAHEIRNPLASIRSAVQQLGDGRVGEDEERRSLIRLVLRESDRLSALLEEFGDFARVDVAERRPVDLAELAAEALETVRQHPDTPADATLELTVEDEPDELWGDRELLHRTLVNLALNAVQAAGEEPPRVAVTLDSLEPDPLAGEADLGAPVRVRVTDNGPGLPDEEPGRIFDPFFTTREGGSGLGLSIAHRAVHAHGGALLASSAPGGGTSMVVVLPRRRRDRTEGEGRTASRDGPEGASPGRAQDREEDERSPAATPTGEKGGEA